MNQDKNQIQIKSPEVLSKIRFGKIKKSAAGIPAILASLRHILQQAGLVRGLRSLNSLNQKGGFDCPSCAWPDPDDDRSSLGEYCENGAKALADEATTRKLSPAFFAKNSISELAILSDYELGKKGRIAQLMHLPAGATHYQPVSWDKAFKSIGECLAKLESPDEAIFYTSGRASNEAAFLYQLFVREYGTNNLPDCSNMCHESSGVALSESLGSGKGSVSLDDFYLAEVIIILGQNPGTNHPRMMSALQKAKENGALIISVNPLPETGLMGFDNPQQIKGLFGIGTTLTDLFLQVRLNGDMALLQAIQVLLLQEERLQPGSVIDREFIEQDTTGFDTFENHLERQDLDKLIEASGVDKAQVVEAALLLKNKKKIIACWAMGLTQHKNAVDSIKEIVNLLLLKGSIGKPGAGTCPVRGHSNVQGDRTMGIYDKPSEAFCASLEKHFGFAVPRKHGFDVVESIKAMASGKASFFMGLGGNFLAASPDTSVTATGLQQCQMTVQVSTKLNRSHLVHGKEAFILPCLGRSDKDIINGNTQFVSCENSMSVVQSSRGMLTPVSKLLLSEPVIIARLAKATLGENSKVDWDNYIENYDHIRDDIEKTIPGFEEYNQRVRQPGGFYLPNCNREGKFDTESKKAEFSINKVTVLHTRPGELLMMTIRSHDQFNTTIYGLNDRYRGIYNERRVILMNQGDMNDFGFKKGEVVDLYNYSGDTKRMANNFLVLPYPIPRGCSATYFPETNILVPVESVADKSNTPTSKSIIIEIKKAGVKINT